MSTQVQTTGYTDATVNGAKRTYLNKEYFDKRLLEFAKTKLVHAKFGAKKSIPGGQGKKVEFRRFNVFAVDEEPVGLAEGVTPDGLDLSQAHVEATCQGYGDFVEVSDMLKTTAYDDVMKASSKLLGEKLGVVIERVTRNAMNAGTNVQYAGGRSSRLTITGTDKLSVTEIRKAVRTLKKSKASMFTFGENGKPRKPHFICICSPDATYDLQSDALWQDVSKYSNAEQIYSGEIGRLFGVVFVESTEAKVFKQSVLNKVNASVTSGHDFVLKSTPSAAAAKFLVDGAKLKAGSLTLTVASYAAATKTVTVDETFSATDKLDADDIVYSEDAGACDGTTKAGLDVHSALVFGADSYGIVDIAGEGTMQTIIKPLGSGGTSDPLNQRASVGAKVGAYTALILNNAWLVRIEHAVSA